MTKPLTCSYGCGPYCIVTVPVEGLERPALLFCPSCAPEQHAGQMASLAEVMPGLRTQALRHLGSARDKHKASSTATQSGE